MGFIENLRRERALINKQLKDAQKLARAESERERARVAQVEEKNMTELGRFNREMEQAEAHFAESEFSRLSEELRSVVGGALDSYKNTFYRYNKQDERVYNSAQFGIKLEWGKRIQNVREKGSYRVYNEVHSFIIIRCDHTGLITLEKSWGDIELPRSKWLGNPAIQEEALGKAYGNPKQVSRERDTSSPDSGPGLSGAR
ncbi:MAG: hypothetical protein HYS83_01525 [Candidatus Blackburnbacteria bacterium]|nr:hypothetical protein [Candidatus Blackburnbacteria bacterium]